MEKIGVNVSPQHGEYSLIATARKTGEWDGIIEGWSTFGNVPVLLASQYAADGSTNYGHYQDEKVTDLLKN